MSVASSIGGRSPRFTDAAIASGFMLGNLFGYALWQAAGLMQSVLQLSGLFDLQRASALCDSASYYGACKCHTYASKVGCACWQIYRHQVAGRACEV
ncbi:MULTISPECIES: hypothetical protein [Comamonas]|uniref:hypothetical protein n=1 Tax=Comamonas TaxID=283 RepID=UPI0035E3C8D8